MKSPISAENRAFREAAPSLGSSGRAAIRLVTYALLTLAAIPFQLLALLLRIGFLARGIPYYYHRLVCGILGLKIEVRGVRSTEAPTLYVGNHVSYLDIETLGSNIPASFVAKQEVSTWPFFNVLAKLQRTVFVERRTRATRASRDSLIGRLEAADSLILFPEGTSSDGTRVLPFRSALFAAAQVTPGGKPLRVQPFTVAYTRLDGIPLGPLLAAVLHLVRRHGDGGPSVERLQARRMQRGDPFPRSGRHHHVRRPQEAQRPLLPRRLARPAIDQPRRAGTGRAGQGGGVVICLYLPPEGEGARRADGGCRRRTPEPVFETSPIRRSAPPSPSGGRQDRGPRLDAPDAW